MPSEGPSAGLVDPNYYGYTWMSDQSVQTPNIANVSWFICTDITTGQLATPGTNCSGGSVSILYGVSSANPYGMRSTCAITGGQVQDANGHPLVGYGVLLGSGYTVNGTFGGTCTGGGQQFQGSFQVTVTHHHACSCYCHDWWTETGMLSLD